MIIGVIITGIVIGWMIGNYIFDKWLKDGNDECNRV
jgi:hypothetical protein